MRDVIYELPLIESLCGTSGIQCNQFVVALELGPNGHYLVSTAKASTFLLDWASEGLAKEISLTMEIVLQLTVTCLRRIKS